MNYYNEFDPYAAQWLRNLIAAGHIPAGDVDERSIKDVPPSDLAGYTQCHFFAGIGGWSEALRLAGWPAGRPVWTGSCPCQPFSNAGARKGTADDRHLWPYWFELIRQCRPATVFGEQVESAIAHGWLDLVQADVEGEGYAFAAAGIPAAGVGAPHGRHRLWFVASALADDIDDGFRPHGRRMDSPTRTGEGNVGQRQRVRAAAADGGTTGGGVADAEHNGCGRQAERLAAKPNRDKPQQRISDGDCAARSMGDADDDGQHRQPLAGLRRAEVHDADGCGSGGVDNPVGNGRRAGGNHYTEHDGQQLDAAGRLGGVGDTDDARSQGRGRVLERPRELFVGPTGMAGFWSDCDWVPCTDGKARPVEPGTFPLAHGVSNRVGRLRAYGNAIVPQVAATFIGAYLET